MQANTFSLRLSLGQRASSFLSRRNTGSLLHKGAVSLVPDAVDKDEAKPVIVRLYHELGVHVARLPPGPVPGGFT